MLLAIGKYWVLGLLALLYFVYAAPTSQNLAAMDEICDNAKDDDGDGFIDLNDPDCDCPEIEPESLIPNPSFEEMECCPSNRSQLNCAKDWIQASEATTDYLHTCGWFGWEDLPPPLPLPDGSAVIGFRDGRFGNLNQPGWKEYTGACLTAPMKAGNTYRFRFYIGFLNPIVSPPTNIVFFGTTNCANLPFGQGNPNFGCPTNDPNWKRLGSARISGNNEWKIIDLSVTPTENIEAIAIGPDCIDVFATGDIYYFFDNLILADQQAFAYEISDKGHPCSQEYTLEIPYYDSLQYQWYKDGIALLGETNATLQVKTGDGNYQVRTLGPTQCRVTSPFRHKTPVFYYEMEKAICNDEYYWFNNIQLNNTGTYWDTLKTAQNCDSIVKLNLRVVGETYDTVTAKIFPGEHYKVGRILYRNPGKYDNVLTSSIGCDSLVYLDLEHYKVFFPNAFSPNGDGANDNFIIYGSPDLIRIKNMQIFDRWGNLVFQGEDIPPNEHAEGWDGRFKGELAPTGVYVFIAQLLMDDGLARSFSGSLTLLR